jgi:hypothetical protein
MKPNKIISLSILNFFFFLLSFSLSHATIRYVSKTGSSTPPYTSWVTAADSIQKCIDICVFGDTIYVANGVYEEQVVMIPGLSLIGAGTDSCIINTQNLVTTTGFVAVEVKDSCVIKFFHIIVFSNSEKGYGIAQSGNSLVTLNRITSAAYGLYVGYTGTKSPVVCNNDIRNVSKGADIFNSNAVVRNNIIYTDPNSQAAVIAGIRLEAFDFNYEPIIDSNYIVTEHIGIRKSFGTKPLITNNTIILKGLGGRGIHLSTSDSVKVYNNSVFSEEGFSGIYNPGVQYLQLNNNYVTGNFFDDPQFYVIEVGPDNVVKNNVVANVLRGIEAWGSENLVVQYNNLWNNVVNNSGFTLDSTNLSVDPMIVNDDTTQGELDFHLQMFSPLIDAGDPNILDRDGSRSDIGLYGGSYGESYIYLDLPPRPPVNPYAEVDSNIITLKWNKNAEADLNYYNLYRDTVKNFQIDTTKLVASIEDTLYLYLIPANIESLYFKVTAVDSQGNESNPSEELAVILTSVSEEHQTVSSYQLYQNYPNPFNPSTTIGYKLKERGYVKLYVYDIKGELVSVLVNQVQEAGYYEVQFNASGSNGHSGLSGINELASGVYIYQIMVRNDNNIPVFSDIKKMVYIK